MPAIQLPSNTLGRKTSSSRKGERGKGSKFAWWGKERTNPAHPPQIQSSPRSCLNSKGVVFSAPVLISVLVAEGFDIPRCPRSETGKVEDRRLVEPCEPRPKPGARDLVLPRGPCVVASVSEHALSESGIVGLKLKSVDGLVMDVTLDVPAGDAPAVDGSIICACEEDVDG